MGNESSSDREKFLKYLENAQIIRDEFRSDLKHQIQRKEIDALNEMTMSSAGGSNLHERNKKTEVGADVVETEYNPSTGHYEQVNSPGTDDYVEGKISSTTSKTGCKEDEGEKNGRIKIFKDSLGVTEKERYNPSPEYLKIIEKTNKRIEEGHRQMDEAYISASSFICHNNNIKDDLQR